MKKKKKQKMKESTKKSFPFLVQSILIILVALSSFLICTAFVYEVLGIKETYLATWYIIQLTYVILLIVTLPILISIYRKKNQELKVLTTAIKGVAEGNYKSKIVPDKKSGLLPVYKDFNKMCDEIESVQILRNDFINSYSHEFKTPIASINGFASLLLEKEQPEETKRQYLQIIVDESARLSNLATSTILLSKLTSQQIVTDMEEYDLSEQLRQCSIILSRSWLEKKIEFSGEFPTAMFTGNRELMQHLWLNLLNNAIKYTPVRGEINASVNQQEESIIVIIEDTGEGMDEDTLKHLFDPYYQGDTSHARQGLGLGLSICKRIVELCNGTISVKSEIGAGSQFTVTLPAK